MYVATGDYRLAYECRHRGTIIIINSYHAQHAFSYTADNLHDKAGTFASYVCVYISTLL